MKKWKKVNICENQIETRTAKAVLVKMPRSSEYKGFMFWLPRKLVKESEYMRGYELLYTDSFTFDLFKSGKGKTNKYEKIAQERIDVEEFENAFKVVQDDFDDYHNFLKQSYYKVQEPERIELGDVEVPEELKQ